MKKRLSLLMFLMLFFSTIVPAYATVDITTEPSTIEGVPTIQGEETTEILLPEKSVGNSKEIVSIAENSKEDTNVNTPSKVSIEEPLQSESSSILEVVKPVARAAIDYGSQFFNEVYFSDIEGNTLAKVKDTDKIKVNYSFAITTPVKEGGTMSIALPKELKLVNYIEFPLKDGEGNTIALVTTEKNTGLITLTFTNYVNEKSNINGELFFWAKLDKTNVTDGNNLITMPVNGVTTDLALKVIKTEGSSPGTTNPTVLFKSGAYDKNDLSVINWTITLNNAQQNLFQPTIIDTIGSGQVLLKNSFVVNYRDAAKKSKNKYLLPTTLANDRTVVLFTDSGFDLKLENLGSYSIINQYSSAVITYKTKVDNSETQYINRASSADESNNSQTRNATVKFYGSGGEASGSVNEAIDEISDIIDESESMDPNELTPLEHTQLEESKNTAQETMDTEEATVEEIDKAKENLEETIKEVTPSEPVENQAVKEVIDNLKEKLKDIAEENPADYTTESWVALEDVKEKAEAIIEKGTNDSNSVTVEEITEIQKQLEETITKLELIPTHETVLGLEKLVTEAEEKQKEEYTNETWVPFDENLSLAKESLQTYKDNAQSIKNTDLLQTTVQLKQSMDQLEPVNAQVVESTTVPISHVKEKQEQFPETGEIQNNLVGLIGLILLTGSLLLYKKKLKKGSH